MASAFPLTWPLSAPLSTPIAQAPPPPFVGMATGPFAAPPSFFAPLQSSLVPTTATGSSTPTFNRATIAYVQDWENVLRAAVSGEPRFMGARRVQNLVTGNSENLSNAAWSKLNAGSGIAPTVTANFATDPIGGSTATRLQLNKGVTSGAGNYCLLEQTPTIVNGGTYVFSIYLKSNSGTPSVTIQANDGVAISGANVTITAGWVRYSILKTVAGTSGEFIVGLNGNLTNTTGTPSNSADVLAWGAQVEAVTLQSNQNPAEYVSVGVLSTPFNGAGVDAIKYFTTKIGNTVASNVVTEATGAAINTSNGASSVTCDATGPRGYMQEGAQGSLTQRLQYTQDFDHTTGAWTQLSGTTVTANSTMAPDGTPTADTLNEGGTTVWHYVGQNGLTKAASPLTYTASVYMKKSGRNWAGINITDAVTNCIAWFDLNTGVVGSISGGTFSSATSTITPAANGFYRCTVTCTTNSVATIGMYCFSTSADTVTSVAGISAAAIILWGAALEEGISFATSYVASTNVAGTRAYETLTYAFASNASNTVGTAYAEVTSLWNTAPAASPVVAFGAATAYPLYSNSEAATVIRTNDGTNNVGKTGLSSTNTAVRKRASSWTGSTLAVAGDGAAAATGTFSGNMGNTAIGVGTPTTGTGTVWNGTIRNLNLYTAAAATASQLTTITT